MTYCGKDQLRILCFALAVFSLLGGCNFVRVSSKESRLQDRAAKPVSPLEKKIIRMNMNVRHEERPNPGSLWNDAQSRSFFFQDAKASLVGDIVTVKVIENAKGSKEAGTKTARKSSLAVSTASFFGIAPNTLADVSAGAEFGNSFDGDGTTSRSGSLTADVTAIVTDVFPNGNMVIEGKREVLINSEKELLSVSGIIRPEDIQQGNTVLSTVIADARIEYTGSGVVSDKQKPGWGMRFLDFIWPF